MTWILSCKTRDADGESVLSVGRQPSEAGMEWVLIAATGTWSETLPFDGRAHVREFAQALLELPDGPEPYEREFSLSLTTHTGREAKVHFATLAVGRDESDGFRPYLAYQSYYAFPDRGGQTGLGLEVICEGFELAPLQAEARALLAALTVS